MKRSAPLVLVMLLAFAPAAEAKRPSCYRIGGTTVAQSPKVRVFYKWIPDGLPDERHYYGCLRRTGKRMFLAEADTNQAYGSSADLFRLHGTLVAWAEGLCGTEDCNAYAETVDLRSRKSIRSFADSRFDVNSTIVDLQLAPSGSLGLMEADTSDPEGFGPYTYNVIGVTAAGSTLLDSGGDIEKSSLAIGGRWVYWTRAGQPRSAPLQ